jgi:hypothetical protein
MSGAGGVAATGPTAPEDNGWAHCCNEARARWGKAKRLSADDLKKAKALLASGQYTRAEIAAEVALHGTRSGAHWPQKKASSVANPDCCGCSDAVHA